MVKATLTGKKQTTTQALGAGIARWIQRAGGYVMLLIDGELTACSVVIFGAGLAVEDTDTGGIWLLKDCRIYRDTVRQIKSMIGLA